MGLLLIPDENNREVSFQNKEYFKKQKQACAFQLYILRFSTLYIKITNFVIWCAGFELFWAPIGVEHWNLLKENRGTVPVFQKVRKVRRERKNKCTFPPPVTCSSWAARKVLH